MGVRAQLGWGGSGQWGCLGANDTGEMSAQKSVDTPKALKHVLILGLLVFTCACRYLMGCEYIQPEF